VAEAPAPAFATPPPSASRGPATSQTAWPEEALPFPSTPPWPPGWSLKDINWEPVIGGNWLARIGALAVIIGAGFFLALAIDNNWINETGRVLLGLVTGSALLGAGEFWRKKYPPYAQALSGAGVAILYLSVFAAYALYELINIYTGVGALALVSATAAGLAIRHNAVWLAVIGIIGAFFAPFVLGGFADSDGESVRGSTSNATWLLIYILAVDIGVIALSTLKNWSWFTALALAGSLATFGLWNAEYVVEPSALVDELGRHDALLIAQAGITGIFLSFIAATTLFHLVWKRMANLVDMSVMMVNAVAFAGISYGLLWTEFRGWMGLLTAAAALLYGGVALLALKRIGITPVNLKDPAREVPLTLVSIGIALIFLTIAIPIQIGGPWVSVAWTAEALTLMWLSLNRRIPEIRHTSLLVFLAAAVSLALVDTAAAFDEPLTPFWNRYLPAYVLVIAGQWAAAFMLRRDAAALRKDEQFLFPLFLVAGIFFLGLGTAVQITGPWLPVAWTLEALGAMWFAFYKRIPEVRYTSMAMFLLAALWLVAADTPDAIEESVTPFWNKYLPIYLIVIASTWTGAFLLRRNAGALRKEESELYPLFMVAGIFLLALGAPVQVEGPWLAVMWTVEGLGVTWVSLRLKIFEMQMVSFGLYGLAAARAIGYDSVVEGDGYTVFWNTRSLAFGPLIVATSASAYLWHVMADARASRPSLQPRYVALGFVAAANGLALWFLSAEVIGAVQADAVVNVTSDNEFNVISLGLTVLWGVYGGLALAAGFIGGWRYVRMGGLVLLAVPVLKLFLLDSSQLEGEFRVVAFLLLGAILLTGGYLYQRHSETFKELFLPGKEKE
jgi:uncharacterized membrane protein